LLKADDHQGRFDFIIVVHMATQIKTKHDFLEISIFRGIAVWVCISVHYDFEFLCEFFFAL
jgi:hypothetical protein